MSRIKRQWTHLGKITSPWNISWVAAFAALLILVITPRSTFASSGFTLTVSQTSVTVQPGSAAVFTIGLQCTSCNVSLGAALSPIVSNGPTMTLSRYHFFSSGGATLRVSAGPSTPMGVYTITATARDSKSATTQSVNVTLVVNNFTIAASPASVTVPAGQTATATVSATALNGFSGTLYYSVNTPSAVTTGLACNLQPDPITLSSTLTSVNSTLSCSGTRGTYNVVITSSPFNGSPVRSTSVTVNVN